jgi:hypothetical protein
MPAPFPPSDTAIVRYRLTRAVAAGPLQPNPLGPSFPNVPSTPERPIGFEDTELFKLDPPARDIAEVERQWREANGPESGKEWHDALFPEPGVAPVTPAPLAEPLDIDAQGLRHRAAGEEDLPATVTEGVPVPGRGVGFADEEAAARSRNRKANAGPAKPAPVTQPVAPAPAQPVNAPKPATPAK